MLDKNYYTLEIENLGDLFTSCTKVIQDSKQDSNTIELADDLCNKISQIQQKLLLPIDTDRNLGIAFTEDYFNVCKKLIHEIEDTLNSLGYVLIIEEVSPKDIKYKDRYQIRYVKTPVSEYWQGNVENLREEYIDEDKQIYTTTSAYEVANRIKQSQESLRILWDRNLDRFFICNAEDFIHSDMVEMAVKQGYYGNKLRQWMISSYTDEYGENVIYYIYAPKGKEKDTYGSDVNEDGYEGKYVYSFGTVTTGSDDKYKDSPLAKALGKYDEHWTLDGWTNNYTPRIVQVESLIEKIVKVGNKWQVQSEKGRNMGTYDTEEEAKKRLQQIEYFKSKKS